jgi:hypothetical protein
MKLQIKDSGAWRNVASFEPAKMAEVEKASAALLQAVACPKTSMRICDGDQVLARCEAPAHTWRFE